MTRQLKLALIILGLLFIVFAALQVSHRDFAAQRRFTIAHECAEHGFNRRLTLPEFEAFVEQCKIEGGYYE